MWATLRTVAGEGPLAVVQIPRTGGGAVSRAISSNYTRLETVGKYQQDPRKARATLRGTRLQSRAAGSGDPVPFGLFRRHLPRDTRYITVLRDPVIRVFADYSMQVTAGDGQGPPDRKKLRTAGRASSMQRASSATATTKARRSRWKTTPTSRSRQVSRGRSPSTRIS